MKSPLLFVSSLLLSLLCAGSLAAQTVYDHFDDGDRDGPQWDFPEFLEQNFTEANSLHIVDGPPSQVHANMTSTQHFRGDFEILMDWREFSSSATSFVMNEPGFGIDIQAADGGDWAAITRRGGPNGGHIDSEAAIGGSMHWGDSLGTNDPDGLFKVTRVGDVIETWYDLGGGWVKQYTFPNAFTSDVRIQSSSYTGDNGTFHAASDYFSFVGTEMFPNVGIQINGSDGPVTVAQGTAVELTVSMSPNLLAGRSGDWFSWAFTPFGLYWLDGSGNWVPSLIPILGFQGAFRNLPSYTTLDTSQLPLGDYEFFFAVDPIANGTPDEVDGFRWDVVHLKVQ